MQRPSLAPIYRRAWVPFKWQRHRKDHRCKMFESHLRQNCMVLQCCCQHLIPLCNQCKSVGFANIVAIVGGVNHVVLKHIFCFLETVRRCLRRVQEKQTQQSVSLSVFLFCRGMTRREAKISRGWRLSGLLCMRHRAAVVAVSSAKQHADETLRKLQAQTK